jgi:hypothetical protein
VPEFFANYTPIPVQPSKAFPKRTSTHRPYLRVKLIDGVRDFSCYAIVDSGADDCVFPSVFAGQLGLDFTSGRPYEFSGAGSRGQVAYFFDLEVEIARVLKYQLSVGFTQAMDASRVGLLGQNGFFDRFDVSFHLRDRRFILQT